MGKDLIPARRQAVNENSTRKATWKRTPNYTWVSRTTRVQSASGNSHTFPTWTDTSLLTKRQLLHDLPTAPTYLWVHLQEKPYACHLCGVRYNQIATLNQHLKKHDVPKSASRNFHCHFCGLRFSHKADLNLHQKQEHEAQPQPYVCRRCKRGFARLSGISGHHCILLEEKTDIPIEIQTAAVKPTEEITVEEPEVVTSIIIQETVLKAEESHEIVQLQEQQPVSTLAKLLHKSCILRFFLIFLDKW